MSVQCHTGVLVVSAPCHSEEYSASSVPLLFSHLSWKRRWDRDSGKLSQSTLEDMGSDDDDGDLETRKSLQDHIPPFRVCECVCVCDEVTVSSVQSVCVCVCICSLCCGCVCMRVCVPTQLCLPMDVCVSITMSQRAPH